MADIKIVEHVVQELPSERPLVAGHKYKVMQADGTLIEYVINSQGEPVFVRGITDEQNDRLQQVTQSLIDKLSNDYTKEQIDVIVENIEDEIVDAIVQSTAAYVPLNSDGSLPSPTTDNNFTMAGEGTYGSIVIPSNHLGILAWNGSAWSKVGEVEIPVATGVDVIDPEGEAFPKEKAVANYVEPTVKKVDSVTERPTKQLFDKETAQIEIGSMLQSTGELTATNHNFRAKIPNSILEVGKEYTLKTPLNSPSTSSKVSFFDSSNSVIDFIPSVTGSTSREVVFTVPENTKYTYLQLGFLPDANTYPLRDNPVVNEVMLNEGSEALPYEPFIDDYILRTEKIERYDDVLNLVDNILVKIPKKNILDQSLTDFTRRYSPGSKSIVPSTGTSHVLAPYIEVKEGEWYVLSREDSNISFASGGYYNSADDVNAIDNIVFFNPVDGNGKTFKVPEGLGIKGVYLNLSRVGTSGETLDGNFQLEVGEQATPYEPYESIEVINPDLLPPENNDAPVDSGVLAELTNVNNVTKIHHNYLPNFFKHCRLKDKDVVVVNTGTSLSARSSEHCTLRADANERPPLMHSNNMMSHIWDAIKWDSQFYRRYDYPDFFTETGTFTTASQNANWDDSAYRDGLTRFAVGAASIEFKIPINAFQFNFIYRSDIDGTENAVVTVAEGNGKVEVFNGTSWVEANGYVFSQKEVEIVVPTAVVINPLTNSPQTLTNYKTGGNTTYQKRLKMRAVDRTIEKSVTISSTSGRLLYWGVEWSTREFMISLINAARGSHGSSLNSTLSVAHYFDNDIVSFKPDLILTENPIHNSGASKEPNTTYPTSYWGVNTEQLFFADNTLSLKSRLENAGVTDVEYLIYTSSISWNFGGINEDGSLKIGTDKDGKHYTALESFSMAHNYLLENHPNVLAVNSANYWVSAGTKAFGDLRTATMGSGKGGNTFTNEGSHWNDTGSKIIAKSILPYLNFEK